MKHELKTWPEPFQALLDGFKTHEIRQDDRGFGLGDELLLREWDPTTSEYSGREAAVGVTYLSRGPDWGLPPALCVMSLEQLWRSDRCSCCGEIDRSVSIRPIMSKTHACCVKCLNEWRDGAATAEEILRARGLR